ncbi:alpha/beta hydrolase [marine bacterium AO1-C]|nr:alpha/beta hydrolase [marine bacterium AO1-C]
MKKIRLGQNLLEYQEKGQGQPIIFIHGAFSNQHTWRKIIPELSKHYRCIVPNWPFGAHKQPFSPQADLTPEGITSLIYEFMEALGLEQVTLIANDTGGAYAQIFTSKYPEKVDQLILSNCEGLEIFPPKKFSSLPKMVQLPGYTRLMAQVFKRKSLLKIPTTFGLLSNSLNKEDLFDLYARNFSCNQAIRRDFKRFAIGWHPKYTQEAAVKLKDFKKPVLVMWGNEDTKLFPVKLGKRIANIFPNARFVEIPQAMTYIQEDQPMAMVQEIKGFLA